MSDKETLKNNLEELLRKMHSLRCIVAKVELKADAHESTIKNMLCDFVTRNDECLREDLYNIVIETHDISKSLSELYRKICETEMMLKKIIKVLKESKGELESSRDKEI